MQLIEPIRRDLLRRPWWMTAMYIFCIYMTFVYMPFDIFWKSTANDEEVWFGITFHQEWAKVLAPLHWFVYAALAWGFFKMRHWMWPWASVYVIQVSFSMVIWNLVDERGGGLMAGLPAGIIFLVPAIALWRAQDLFRSG
jgi:hypothetical protein